VDLSPTGHLAAAGSPRLSSVVFSSIFTALAFI
jgi:hypothetical protein